mgnify:CR=1 FL=1|jgi:hypothetical protein
MDYERFVFQQYKNKVLSKRKVFIDEVSSKFRGVDGAKLYKEIIDYQIMMYGYQLQKETTKLDYDQFVRGWRNKKNRRYQNGIRRFRKI